MKPEKVFESVLKNGQGTYGAWRQTIAGDEYIVTTDSHRIFASRSAGRVVEGRTALSHDRILDLVEPALAVPRRRLKGAVLDAVSVRSASVLVSLWSGPSEELCAQGVISGDSMQQAEGLIVPKAPHEAVQFSGLYLADAALLVRRRTVRKTLIIDSIFVGLRGALDPTIFAADESAAPEHIYLLMPVAK